MLANVPGLENPVYLNSIFIGIKRAALEGLDFGALMRERRSFSVCCRWLGYREVFTGYVDSVVMLPYGTLAMVRPTGGFLKWDIAPLWVPNQGTCGILSTWRTEKMFRRELTEESRCH